MTKMVSYCSNYDFLFWKKWFNFFYPAIIRIFNQIFNLRYCKLSQTLIGLVYPLAIGNAFRLLWAGAEISQKKTGDYNKQDQQNNKFYVFVLKDEFQISYARILGPIKQLESEEEAVFFLIKNQVPGAKVYLENDLFKDETWMAVLSQDTPVDGRFISKPMLLKTLEKLDGSLSRIKQEFEYSQKNSAAPIFWEITGPSVSGLSRIYPNLNTPFFKRGWKVFLPKAGML